MSNEPVDLRDWGHFMRQPAIMMDPRKLLNPGDAVFTIGSCFAAEVRKALSAAGFTCYPNYAGVSYDKTQEIYDRIPEREMLQHYDTFSMRQEFEAALGQWSDRARGFWPVAGATANKILKSPEVVQDPYRKLVYASSRDRLADLSQRITAAVREGLEKAKIFVITLGLTEVWRHNATGKYLCRPPGTGFGGGEGQATFRQSSFMENYENMQAILRLLFDRYPEKHVIVSVSPVRLAYTYSNVDIGTANLESKSILRAVAGQIVRDNPGRTTYYPSYEMAMAGLGALTGTGTVFEDDGRHVRPAFVDQVTKSFVRLVT